MMLPRNLLVVVSIHLAVLGAAGVTGAAEPAAKPNPTTKPSADSESAIKKSFDDLGDSDPDVRDAARVSLMGMERRYLPTLEKLVEKNRPLLPSQAVVLRQIVTHVYLAGEPYDADERFGFLGVRMTETSVSLPAEEEKRAAGGAAEKPRQVNAPDPGPVNPAPAVVVEDATVEQVGVVISERLPGFVGNRMLLEGDVVVGIAEQPDLRFRSQDDFTEAVKGAGGGKELHFHVLRRGRIIEVPITLDSRPTAAEAGQMQIFPFDRGRRERAEKYWRESFAPLVRDGVG
jgi:hypothetical protein